MNTYCDICGQPVDTKVEPLAIKRDSFFVICDACDSMTDEQHSHLAVINRQGFPLPLKH